jgi:hypothetical protein
MSPFTPRVFRAAVVAALVLSSLSCRDATSPVPPDARQFTPEPVFRDWWRQMEECSGHQAPFDDVRWFVVPGEDPFPAPGVDHLVFGYWHARENLIVLLQFLPNSRAPVIRHEALHAILRTADHPPLYFETLCGPTIGSPDSPDLPLRR